MIMMKQSSYMRKIKEYSYPFFAATFGLTPFVSSVALGVFLLGHLSFPQIWGLKEYKKVLYLSIPYLIILYSSLYSYNSYEAVKFLFRTCLLFLLPFLMAVHKKELGDLKQLVILFYIYGLFVSCILSLIIGSYFFSVSGDIQVFLYYDLAGYLSLHPTYYSLYLIVGIVFLLFSKLQLKGLQLIAFLLFTLTLVLLQTRIAYIILGLLLLLKIFQSKRRIRIYWIGLLSFMIVFIIFLMPKSFKESKQIFPETSDYSALIGTQMENGITQRIWLWSNAIEQIKERPLLGYGLKSQQDIFKWKVHKEILMNETDSAYNEAALEVAQLNLHNQYMQIFYEAGLIGLLLFILGSGLVIAIAIKDRKFLFLLIYMSYLAFLFTENLLDRQMGIYFYSFMMPFFFLYTGNSSNPDYRKEEIG